MSGHQPGVQLAPEQEHWLDEGAAIFSLGMATTVTPTKPAIAAASLSGDAATMPGLQSGDGKGGDDDDGSGSDEENRDENSGTGSGEGGERESDGEGEEDEEDDEDDEDDDDDDGKKNDDDDDNEDAAIDELFTQECDQFEEDDPRIAMLRELQEDLKEGHCCTRWALLTLKQKKIVLRRVMSVAQSRMVQELQQDEDPPAIVLQGSYFFGSESVTPGDVDVLIDSNDKIIRRDWKNPQIEDVIGAEAERKVKEDGVKIGFKMSVADVICSVVLNAPPISFFPEEADDDEEGGSDDDEEADDPVEEANECFASAYDGLQSLINKGVPKDLADKNYDKAARKIVNIATILLFAIDALREHADDQTLFEDWRERCVNVITAGNKKISSGSFHSLPANFSKLYKEALDFWEELSAERDELMKKR